MTVNLFLKLLAYKIPCIDLTIYLLAILKWGYFKVDGCCAFQLNWYARHLQNILSLFLEINSIKIIQTIKGCRKTWKIWEKSIKCRISGSIYEFVYLYV